MLHYKYLREELIRDVMGNEVQAEVWEMTGQYLPVLTWYLIPYKDDRMVAFSDKAYVHYWLRGWSMTERVLTPAEYAVMNDYDPDEGCYMNILLSSVDLLDTFRPPVQEGPRSWNDEARCPVCKKPHLDFTFLQAREDNAVSYVFQCGACGNTGHEVWDVTFRGIEIDEVEGTEPIAPVPLPDSPKVGERYVHYKGGIYDVIGFVLFVEKDEKARKQMGWAFIQQDGEQVPMWVDTPDDKLVVLTTNPALYGKKHVLYQDYQAKFKWLREVDEWFTTMDDGRKRFTKTERHV
jgi:hypothetical protein